MSAVAVGNGRERQSRETPVGYELEQIEVEDTHLQKIVRDALRLELRRAMPKRLFIVVSSLLLAMFVGLCFGMAFLLWGPGS